MPEKHTYEYAFIRYVPQVEREEFINVGVILFCKRMKYLEVKYQVDPRRLKAFSSVYSAGDLEQFLQTWALICNGDERGGAIAQLALPERFRWLTAIRSTVVQCSNVHPGLCTDPKAVLEKLFNQYVWLQE